MSRLFILGMAGACGTISRYLLGGAVYNIFGNGFPYGTLFVNVTGCLAIGFVGTLADEKFLLTPALRAALLWGFLGAFTTFSSFTYETWNLFKDGQYWFAGLNVIGSFILCFLGLLIGVFTARFF